MITGNTIRLGKKSVSSGEIILASAWAKSIRIKHNLGSRKILLILQQINSDGSTSYSSTGDWNDSIGGIYISPEAAGFNVHQGYKKAADWATAYLVEEWDQSRRAAGTMGIMFASSSARKDTSNYADTYYFRLVVEDENSVLAYTRWRFNTGRWLWKACVCDLEDWDEV